MIKRTKVNLIKWIKTIWNIDIKLDFVAKSFDDPAKYRNRLSNIVRKAIENLPADELVQIAATLDIDIVEQLWNRTLTRINKDDLVQSIVTGGYGYDTEEDVWAAMECDLSDKKGGTKTRAWYAFWQSKNRTTP